MPRFSLLAAAASAVVLFAVPVSAHNLLVDVNDPDAEYAQIQDAVDDAEQGDTILVAPGTYEPFVVVTDKLKIRAADDDERPVVDGSTNPGVFEPAGLYYAINIDADMCTLEGFEVVGTTEGEDVAYGILITEHQNKVNDNYVTGNTHGIGVFGLHVDGGLHRNRLKHNTCIENEIAGIEVLGSIGGEFKDNVAIGQGIELPDGGVYGFGILVGLGADNKIKDNFAGDNPQGITLGASSGDELSKNTSVDNDLGFNVTECTDVTIKDNEARDNFVDGFNLSLSDGITV
ncbi:MAG: right-handed parallel beta-helix repeat-containing protein, partial [Planctomycetota bacterium]